MQKTITPPDTKLESGILGCLSHRENWDLYSTYADNKRLLPNTVVLLQDYKKYFETYKDHESIDWGVFYTAFSQVWHEKDLEDQEIDYYKTYVFPAIQAADSTAVNECLLKLIERSTLQTLKDIEGLDPDRIADVLADFESKKLALGGEEKKEEEGDNIFSLDFSVLDKSKGIPLFLPSLQASLGSLVLGQFIVVAADIGTGKSAFVISQLVHTFKHLYKTEDVRPVLYFNSEGTSADVMDRFFSNLYHKQYPDGFEEIHLKQGEVFKRFTEGFPDQAGNLWVFPISKVGTFQAIKRKIKQYKPALVIIDIVDKLADEEDAQSLKKLYDNLRVLSADMCPIIGTSQAGNQEYFDKENNQLKNRKWLSDKALYGAKQKGGAADTMIMLGKDDNDPNIRYIAVTKNKRGQPIKVTCNLLSKFSRYQELDW